MTPAPELIVSLPLATSAILIALLDRIPGRVTQWIAIVIATVTLGGTVVVLADVARHGTYVAWVGGWHPGNRVGLGIELSVDLAAACVGSLVAATVLGAIVFSHQYFEDVGAIFYVLILAMLGAMIAFAFAGDIFDLFVWYEVFSVAAYALSAYRTESESAYQGALQFALTNSVAGLFFLLGISLLEGRTGELNLVAIGHSLAARGSADPLVAASLAFIAIGLFTRGALAPLHFWFDEVHAAAPAPLCAILSGAMAPLALYGFARIYWTVFARALPPSRMLIDAMFALGVLSAVVGTVMALRESRLKRKLAHATVAHSGVALAAIGDFTPRALAAAGVYAASYAAAAAALFCAIAILRVRTNEYDAKHLEGKGHSLPLTSAAFVLASGTLATAWSGGRAAANIGSGPAEILTALLVIFVGAGTGGAFLGVFVSIFLRRPHSSGSRSDELPWFLLGPALALALLSVALGALPPICDVAQTAATMMTDSKAHTGAALRPGIAGWLAPLGALGVAFVAVAPAQSFRRMRIVFARNAFVHGLRAISDGDAGGYIAWIAGSAAVLATLIAWSSLR